MPRQGRLNVPGAIHHIIARGLERKVIFKDDADRNEFLARLSHALEKTRFHCYAWVLMPNHFHLMIRSPGRPLSDLMRGLLTGYALYFNRRHRRSGYLYQNRYKSILCQEEPYFLELVRYIHLNPMRAKMLTNLGSLDAYPWSGHSAILGRVRRKWQETGEVLARFGSNGKAAVQRYREYVADGLPMGYRSDLMGGGLRRSAGGWEGVERLKQENERQRGDERILGDGEFVNQALKSAEEKLKRAEAWKRQGWNWEKLVKIICERVGVKQEDLRKKGRQNAISQAKGLLAYLGTKELGISGGFIAGYLQISRPALIRNRVQGEKLAQESDFKLLN